MDLQEGRGWGGGAGVELAPSPRALASSLLFHLVPVPKSSLRPCLLRSRSRPAQHSGYRQPRSPGPSTLNGRLVPGRDRRRMAARSHKAHAAPAPPPTVASLRHPCHEAAGRAVPRSASRPHLALPGVHAGLRAAVHPFSICPPVGADPAAGGESPVCCGDGHLGDALPWGHNCCPLPSPWRHRRAGLGVWVAAVAPGCCSVL